MREYLIVIVAAVLLLACKNEERVKECEDRCYVAFPDQTLCPYPDAPKNLAAADEAKLTAEYQACLKKVAKARNDCFADCKKK